MNVRQASRIDRVETAVYRIPTETPEADGTFEWDHTTLVLVEATAGGTTGLGYSYADTATAIVIRETLAKLALGRDAMDVRGVGDAMCAGVRNLGRPGICAMAISAVDSALWDLKARLLGIPLVSLLGAVRESLPIYGSGGFTNYSNAQLQNQLGGWVRSGIPRVKMKIGRDAAADMDRVAAARKAIGREAELFVDANGAYSRKQALAQAEAFSAAGVTWFEEPVSSDDLEGLRLLRDRAPPGMEIAAGEYGYNADYFRHMLEEGAVDVLQADATRCCGITGFLQAGALCDAFHVPMSSHCAPALHVHPGCAVTCLRHAEYFFDHVRIEKLLFDGAPEPKNGALYPDLNRSGHGLEFKRADAARYLHPF
jgi:L-alanine-DL-glutamate epimerase-like enolase superfamily enzyme